MDETQSQTILKQNQLRIDAENRIRFYTWFDNLPLFHRDWINEYGFAQWFTLRDQMNGAGYQFELKLKSWREHHPPLTGDVP